jgi:hypothetical protein
VYLGQQGEAGREKESVLDTLSKLAAHLQGQQNYEGYGLEQLVHGVETTLIGGARPGDPDNYLQAAVLLERILLRLRSRRLSLANDTVTTLRTLERLGSASLRFDSERAAVATLQAVASAAEGEGEAFQFVSEGLFKLGAVALDEGKHFVVAVAALNKLEALAERRAPLNGEMAVDLLGLIAHFWTGGPTAQRHARTVLARVKGLFDHSVERCIQAAVEHQYRTTQFDTADKLIQMLETLSVHEREPCLVAKA